MASNFECIGMAFPDAEAFEEYLGALAQEATRQLAPTSRWEHRRWVDPSGASVTFHLENGNIDCLTPFFDPPDGLTRWRVRTSGAHLASCRHCSGADCDLLDEQGEMVTRAGVQWLNFAPYERWLRTERTYELEVVGFAHEARFFDTPEQFEAAQSEAVGDAPVTPDGKPLRFAENAFLPTGMFASPDADFESSADVFGRVMSVERRVNAGTGGAFYRIRVEALPGLLDVVVPPLGDDDAAPRVGQQAWLGVWLVGRPVPQPEGSGEGPEERRGDGGILRRLFGGR